MHKTLVYTLVNGNIEELAHRKQQKLQKVILPASHWLRVSVLLNNRVSDFDSVGGRIFGFPIGKRSCR